MDAAAFATFYDRYERSVYNLCYRITGSPDDAADATQETFLKVLERLPALEGRELNLAAYVMTVARNASYDAIERRKRSTPTSDLPEVADERELPERSLLRQAHQQQIRAANEGLPPRQREVLALRELQDLSYGEVAQIMGMNPNSVAQLISRARINLRDGLRQTALGSVASASPQCDRALPLLASRQDGVLEDPWLAEHLMACGACRVRLEAMEEAAVAYRQWALLVPPLWLREDVAQAAERWRPASHRARHLLTAGAVVLALALVVSVDGAEAPTRAFAPAPTPVATAPSPVPVAVEKPRTKKQRSAPRRVAPKPRVVEAPAREIVVAAVPARPVATSTPTPAPEIERPARRPRAARPPAPTEPAAPPPPVAEVPVPPPAETPTPTPEPPPPPPPPRPAVCKTCGIVAAPREPEPPRRIPAVPRTP